jgi:hypothetical protein
MADGGRWSRGRRSGGWKGSEERSGVDVEKQKRNKPAQRLPTAVSSPYHNACQRPFLHHTTTLGNGRFFIQPQRLPTAVSSFNHNACQRPFLHSMSRLQSHRWFAGTSEFWGIDRLYWTHVKVLVGQLLGCGSDIAQVHCEVDGAPIAGHTSSSMPAPTSSNSTGSDAASNPAGPMPPMLFGHPISRVEIVGVVVQLYWSESKIQFIGMDGHESRVGWG